MKQPPGISLDFSPRYFLMAACLFFLILSCTRADAHPFGGVFQKTYLYPMGPFFLMEYETHIGRDVLLTLNPDSNGNYRLSDKEKDRLLERLSVILLPNLKATLNEVPLTFTEISRNLKIENPKNFREGVNSSFIFHLSIPPKPDGKKIFRFSDHNFLAGEMDRLNYFHGVMGDCSGARLLEHGRDIELFFDLNSVLKTKNETPPLVTTAPGSGNSESDLLSRYFNEGQSGATLFFGAILTAFALGAAHALSPGHGKAMVAAYLVGSQGRIHHAFWLGLIVTFTHVAIVVILGITALILSDHFLPQNLFPWLGRISGGMIFLIGYWMLAKRALHHMDHTHPHSHHHEISDDKISLKSLVSLGVAGGIVPCPSALVILLLSLSFQRVPEGLALIFFFSLGLAAILILIGVLTVTASKFADRFSQTRVWIQRLPVFSAGCIMIIGITIVFNSLLSS